MALLLLLASVVVLSAAISAAVVLIVGHGSWLTVYDAYTGNAIGCALAITNGQRFGVLLLGLFALWAYELFYTIRFATVSLATGIWFFEEGQAGSSEGGSEALHVPLKAQSRSAPVSTALGLACTKSFGSLCFAALIITTCEILKSMARRSARGNWLGMLIACCIMCIINCIEFLTRFAITFHSLTGDPFCHSAQTFTSHCSRHGLNVITVDYLSTVVLRFGSAILALAITAISFAIFYASFTTTERAALTSLDASVTYLIFGLSSYICALLPLSFVGGIMLNIIDAAYACLVLDIDVNAGSGQPQLAYAVFTCVSAGGNLKKSDLVISQPGNGTPVIAVATPVNPPPMGAGHMGAGHVAIPIMSQHAVTPVAYATPGQPAVAYAQPVGGPPMAMAYATPVAAPGQPLNAHPGAYPAPLAVASPVVHQPMGGSI